MMVDTKKRLPSFFMLYLDLQKVIDETAHYFDYIKAMRKLKRKLPVQYRLEQAV